MRFEGQHYLVTGGLGFIGSHTVFALLKEGAFVTILDRHDKDDFRYYDDSAPYTHHIRYVQGWVESPNIWQDIFDAHRPWDGIIHLAAQTSTAFSIENPLASLEANIKGFVGLLEWVRQFCPHIPVIYASSAAVYGDLNGELAEEKENTHLFPQSPYGLEKYTMDGYASLYHMLYDMHLIGLRYFNVFGSGQDPFSAYSGVIARFVESFMSSETPCLTIYGDGLQTRDFISVSDVIHANLQALTGCKAGIYNIATGSSVTLIQLIQTLEKITGKKAHINFEPARKGDIIFSRASVEKARSYDLLPEYPTSLEDGLSVLLSYTSKKKGGIS